MAYQREAPHHFIHLAWADLLGSRVRSRALKMGEPGLWTLYLELLFASYAAGGRLPAEPELLSDDVVTPLDEVRRLLPILLELGRLPGAAGLRIDEDGSLINVRVVQEFAAERAYREAKAESGREGAREKWKKERLKKREREPSPRVETSEAGPSACGTDGTAIRSDDKGRQVDGTAIRSDDSPAPSPDPSPNEEREAPPAPGRSLRSAGGRRKVRTPAPDRFSEAELAELREYTAAHRPDLLPRFEAVLEKFLGHRRARGEVLAEWVEGGKCWIQDERREPSATAAAPTEDRGAIRAELEAEAARLHGPGPSEAREQFYLLAADQTGVPRSRKDVADDLLRFERAALGDMIRRTNHSAGVGAAA